MSDQGLEGHTKKGTILALSEGRILLMELGWALCASQSAYPALKTWSDCRACRKASSDVKSIQLALLSGVVSLGWAKWMESKQAQNLCRKLLQKTMNKR